MNHRRIIFSVCAVIGALAIAGCGDDDSSTTAAEGGDASTADESASVDTSTKPVVETSGGKPPAELGTTDIVEGDGPTAEPGSAVTVQYVGVDFETGEQFDASWDRGQPFPFQLGAGMVIPGWDQGIEGMKVGGRRELVIPPELAYGKQGFPPDIAPNATLVFVVDLVDVQ